MNSDAVSIVQLVTPQGGLDPRLPQGGDRVRDINLKEGLGREGLGVESPTSFPNLCQGQA